MHLRWAFQAFCICTVAASVSFSLDALAILPFSKAFGLPSICCTSDLIQHQTLFEIPLKQQPLFRHSSTLTYKMQSSRTGPFTIELKLRKASENSYKTASTFLLHCQVCIHTEYFLQDIFLALYSKTGAVFQYRKKVW